MKLTPLECRSAYASYYEKNQKFYVVAPHRRRSLESRILIARYSSRRNVRWLCRIIEDWIKYGPS